jgi:HicB_like antitoxin of bacterial toxin-antitoxin system
MATTSFTVVIEPEDEGGFSVYVPDLPGCASQGESQAEALANRRDSGGREDRPFKLQILAASLAEMGRSVHSHRSPDRPKRPISTVCTGGSRR